MRTKEHLRIDNMSSKGTINKVLMMCPQANLFVRNEIVSMSSFFYIVLSIRQSSGVEYEKDTRVSLASSFFPIATNSSS